MNLNLQIIIKFLGLLLILNGGFMLLCIPASLYYMEGGLWPLISSAGITIGLGAFAWLLTRKTNQIIRKRDGYLVVTMGWLVMSLTGTLPYILSGTIPGFISAFFETVSGYTTTGASVLSDIEAVPKGILLWRSFTHWIGGMGIIVLTIAILPILGIGGMALFMAEAPGPSADKITPRITETAKRLWLIYVGLTIAETLLLMLGGMNFFDSLNHSFATVSTGGFSTKNASIAHFENPYIHYVIILFMILSGVNFSLTYFGLRGNFKKVWENEEFRAFLVCILLATTVSTFVIYCNTESGGEKSFRDALFQVVAVITTTGFVSADFTTWAPFTTVLFFALMFLGGSAGSTAGGVKIVRHLIILKNSLMEFKRLIHPSAVVPVRLNRRAVNESITFNIMAFLIIYMLLFFGGALFMGSIGLDFVTAVGSSASCLGNVGPGFGAVSPVDNYGAIPAAGKLLLSFQMMVGRLELFTVLILFTPYFWKEN